MMGGRGAGSGAGLMSSGGPLAKVDKPVELINEKSRSSGDRWKHDIYEAKHVGGGELVIGYAEAKSYEHPNNNTTVAHYELEHGMWSSQPGDRSFGEIGINWDKVTAVSGKTYIIKDWLKENGFKWESGSKRWVRKQPAKDVQNQDNYHYVWDEKAGKYKKVYVK